MDVAKKNGRKPDTGIDKKISIKRRRDLEKEEEVENGDKAEELPAETLQVQLLGQSSLQELHGSFIIKDPKAQTTFHAKYENVEGDIYKNRAT